MSTKTEEYTMTDEHKQALAEGRDQSRVVKSYLVALESFQPKRGRKRDPKAVSKRIFDIEGLLPVEEDPLARLQLISERDRLVEELDRLTVGSELPALEEQFVEVAHAYATRKGISYDAFREIGVPAAVLREAKVSRIAA